MKSKKWHQDDVDKLVKLKEKNLTWVEISSKFPGSTPNACRKAYDNNVRHKEKPSPVKVLLVDIETAPILAYVWRLFDQNVALNQVVENSSILSWSAKWLGSDEVMYQDVRGQKNLRDDKRILKNLWNLLDEADIVLGQNSDRFDVPIINARLVINGYKPYARFQKLDTLKIAKKNFKFDSNKLEYTTSILCEQHKKLTHSKFPGFSLWAECLKGNLEAFEEMEKYNKMDVISLEEYYNKIKAWDNTINWNVYHDEETTYCSCGSTDFKKTSKFHVTKTSKFQLYVCKSCGKTLQGRDNLLDIEKRKSLKK